MQCPKLEDLPPPPSSRTGWPWTLASDSLEPSAAHPTISVVVPSFNQAHYLEATLRSILLQGYPALELFVLDGGSRDDSVAVIKKYERWITRWVSEPDGGQSAAINRGLGWSTGAFATWINSDDLLCQNALVSHARQVGFEPGVVYVGDCWYIDESGRPQRLHRGRVHTLEDLVDVRAVWRDESNRGHIVQPEVLFPRQLTMDLGALDEANHRTMDYELWGKFFLAGAAFRYTHIPFAMFRQHGQQKTSQVWATTRSLVNTALKLVDQATDLPPARKRELSDALRSYEREYWLASGPLARARLPEPMVLRLREFNLGMRRRLGKIVRGQRKAG